MEGHRHCRECGNPTVLIRQYNSNKNIFICETCEILYFDWYKNCETVMNKQVRIWELLNAK